MANDEAIGPLLARIRRTHRWSQADFATQLAGASGLTTLTRHEISRWERGERVPSRYWLRWIAVVAEVPPADVEEAAAIARALRRRVPVPGLMVPEIIPDADLGDRLSKALANPERIDDASVDWLASCLNAHRRAEDVLGAQPLVGVARAQLAVIAELTRQAAAQRRSRLIDLASQYAQFLGWMAVAVSDQAAASAWYDRSHVWAVEAGNSDLAATSLSMQAHQAWGAGDGARCITLAHASRSYQGPISDGLQGMAAQTSARGYALLGDADGARRDLDEAAKQLLRASDPDLTEPSWLYFYDNSWLARQRGTIELQLGNFKLAADLLARGFADASPDYRRDHAWIGGCLTLAYASSGQSEAAVDTAIQVAPDAVAVSLYGLRKLQEAAIVLEAVDPRRAAILREATRQPDSGD